MDSRPSSVFVRSLDDGIAKVNRGNYAFLMESTMLDYVVQVTESRALRVQVSRVALLSFCFLARLQPHSDRRAARFQGIRDRDAQGLQVEGQDLAGNSRAAGDADHSDALQQMVEEHRRRVYSTGVHQNIKGANFNLCSKNANMFPSGQEQGLQGAPSEREEHRRRVRGAAVRPQPRHHRRHSRVLLELAEKCPE